MEKNTYACRSAHIYTIYVCVYTKSNFIQKLKKNITYILFASVDVRILNIKRAAGKKFRIILTNIHTAMQAVILSMELCR